MWMEKSSSILKQRIRENKFNAVDFEEELLVREELYRTTQHNKLGPEITRKTIEGEYLVVGCNSTDAVSGYIGVLTLSREEHQIRASWLIEGYKEQNGYGLLFGNILCLNFNYESGINEYDGIVAYHFMTNECIGGLWTEQISDTIGYEMGRKLAYVKKDPLDYFGIN
ncbi:hypothetical protein [uncultured Polaribacter sp.]|uniref:hypothetical protein n=1 Tax=uncultured Polaribacter sp. TaxID=174711 RepID=UPI00262CDF66|nr:hypothetical protein [uncultured Polaribacter sp.]